MSSDSEHAILTGTENPVKTNKRLSVERIYQKKTQLEHILLRPDTYIGSVEKVTQVWCKICLCIRMSCKYFILILNAQDLVKFFK